jgi:hypothetical protein
VRVTVNPFLTSKSGVDAKAEEKTKNWYEAIFFAMPFGTFGKTASDSRKYEAHNLANPFTRGH